LFNSEMDELRRILEEQNGNVARQLDRVLR
jgi:hypothetical protein